MSKKPSFLYAPLEQWPQLVLDPALKFEWHPNFWGYLVRSDPWDIDGLVRDWNILHLIFDGDIACQTDDEQFRLLSDTMLWLPPGVRLSMHWSRPFSFTEFRFRLWKGSRQYRFPEAVYLNSEVPTINLLKVMQQINDELLMSQKNHELMLRVLLSQLLLKLVRGADNTVRGGGSLNQAQRQWLREFARDNMQRRHSIKELANGVRLSPDYFCRVFRQTYGVTPSRWMLQERMQAAGRLLHESTLNISEVSERFGYTDVALFSRQFKEIIGTSPLRFRSAHG